MRTTVMARQEGISGFDVNRFLNSHCLPHSSDMHHSVAYGTHQPLRAETTANGSVAYDSLKHHHGRHHQNISANIQTNSAEPQFTTLESVPRQSSPQQLHQAPPPLPFPHASPYPMHLPPAVYRQHHPSMPPRSPNQPAYYLGVRENSLPPYGPIPAHMLPPLPSSDPHRAISYGSRPLPTSGVTSSPTQSLQQQPSLDSRGRKTASSNALPPPSSSLPSYTRDYLESTRDYYNRNHQPPPLSSPSAKSSGTAQQHRPGAVHESSSSDGRSNGENDRHRIPSDDGHKSHHHSSLSRHSDSHRRSEASGNDAHRLRSSSNAHQAVAVQQGVSSVHERFSIDALVKQPTTSAAAEVHPLAEAGKPKVADNIGNAKETRDGEHMEKEQHGRHFKIPKNRPGNGSGKGGTQQTEHKSDVPTVSGRGPAAADPTNVLSDIKVPTQHNDASQTDTSGEASAVQQPVVHCLPITSSAGSSASPGVAKLPGDSVTEPIALTSQPVKAKTGKSDDDDFQADERNSEEESSEDEQSEEDDASESDYEDDKRKKALVVAKKKPAHRRAAVSSESEGEKPRATPKQPSQPAASGAPPKIRSGYHEVAIEGSASDRLALRRVRTMAEQDPETYGLRRSGRQRAVPVRFCGNAADTFGSDLSGAEEDDLGYREPKPAKKVASRAAADDENADDDDAEVGKRRSGRRRRGPKLAEEDSDYEGGGAGESSTKKRADRAVVDDDSDEEEEDELEYDSEDERGLSDEDDFIVDDDASDENFSRSRARGDPWARKRGTTGGRSSRSRRRGGKKSSRRDKIRKKRSSQPPRIRSSKPQQNRSGSTMRENLKKWDNPRGAWAADYSDEDDDEVVASKRNRKRPVANNNANAEDADAVMSPSAAAVVNELDVRRSERQAVRASRHTSQQVDVAANGGAQKSFSRYAVDQLSDTDPDDVLSWTMENANVNDVAADGHLNGADAGPPTSVIEKVLDARQGRRGATGEATTCYNCEQFGDPNLKPPLAAEDAVSDASPLETQYLIKWDGQSYLHCTWETEETLKALKCKALKKLENFVKRRQEHEQAKQKAEPEEREYIACQDEMQRDLIEQHKILERIIARRVVQVPDDEPTPPSSPAADAVENGNQPVATATGKADVKPDPDLLMPKKEEPVVVKTDAGDMAAIVDAANAVKKEDSAETKREADENEQQPPPKPIRPVKLVDQVEFYCKWTGLPYAESTWEKSDLITDRFPDAVTDFERRCKNINRLPHVEKRPKCIHQRPKFRLISEQPDYVGPSSSDLQLRDYQLEGLNWLVNSWTKRNGSILADEMGLGKTIQTISFINYLFHEYDLYGPYLLVVPLSTMTAWQKESALWAPELNIITYLGDASSREVIRQFEWRDDDYAPKKLKFHVLLTTYEILLRDKTLLGEIDWAVLMVDEAHRLKNDDSQLYSELFAFKTDHRILITGTPLQNSLKELWALLHFIMWDKFPSWPEFEHEHAKSAERGYDSLHGILQPFLLRRVKKEVEKSLPAKVEQILRVEMTPSQKQVYRWILTKNYAALAKGLRGNFSGFLNILMELKKCCNHVHLIRPTEVEMTPRETLSYLVRNSGKLVLLDKLLSRLKERGSRVLIFSQMVRLLDILATYLKLKGYQFQRLDGTIGGDMRRQAMEHFNAPNSPDFCFLLSTRAGGLGINLATADTVVIFDSDWNPQNDLQAQARAHRIGQKKQVNIYRLVTSDSVEQDIVDRAKRKMVLDHLVIQRMDSSGRSIVGAAAMKSNSSGNLPFDKDEVAAIIKFGAKGLFDDPAAASDGTENPGGGNIAENEPMPNVDIDEILRRAENASQEDAVAGGKSAAEELLSQFKVASFAMDAEQVDGEKAGVDGGENDAAPSAAGERKELTWDDIIPDAVRKRMQEEAQERMAKALAETRPQRRAAKSKSAAVSAALLGGKQVGKKKSTKKGGVRPASSSGSERSAEAGAPASDDSEANDADEDDESGTASDASGEQEKPIAVGKQTKSAAKRPRTALTASSAAASQPKTRLQLGRHFTQLEVKRFIEAWKKFAEPLARLDAIVADADLQDKSQQHLRMLAEELDARLHAALAEPEPEESCDADNNADSDSSDAEGENSNDAAKKSKKKVQKKARRKRNFVFKLCSLALNAQTIMRSREELMPLGYFIRFVPGGDVYQFQVPGKVRAMNVWNCEWTADDDSRLLVGIYLYGMGHWDGIKHDAKLRLTSKILPARHDQKPQARHLQQRVEWLLKHLKKEMEDDLQKKQTQSSKLLITTTTLLRKVSSTSANDKKTSRPAAADKTKKRKRGDHGDSCDESDDEGSDTDDTSENSDVSEEGNDAAPPDSNSNSNVTTSPPPEKAVSSNQPSTKKAKTTAAKKQPESQPTTGKPKAEPKTTSTSRVRGTKRAPVSKAQVDSSDDSSSSSDDEDRTKPKPAARRKPNNAVADSKKRQSTGKDILTTKRMKQSVTVAAVVNGKTPAVAADGHESVSDDEAAGDDGEEMPAAEFQKCKELLRPMKHQLIAIDKASNVPGAEAQLAAMRQPLIVVGRFIKNTAATKLAAHQRQITTSASTGKTAAAVDANNKAVKAIKKLKQNLWNFVAKFTEHSGVQLNRYFKQHDAVASPPGTQSSNKFAHRIVSPSSKSGEAVQSKKITKLAVALPTSENVVAANVAKSTTKKLPAIPKLIIKTPTAATAPIPSSAPKTDDDANLPPTTKGTTSSRAVAKNSSGRRRDAAPPDDKLAVGVPVTTDVSTSESKSSAVASTTQQSKSRNKSSGNKRSAASCDDADDTNVVDGVQQRASKKPNVASSTSADKTTSQPDKNHSESTTGEQKSSLERSFTSSTLSSSSELDQKNIATEDVVMPSVPEADAVQPPAVAANASRRSSSSSSSPTKSSSRRERLPPSYRYKSHASEQQMELQQYSSSSSSGGVVHDAVQPAAQADTSAASMPPTGAAQCKLSSSQSSSASPPPSPAAKAVPEESAPPAAADVPSSSTVVDAGDAEANSADTTLGKIHSPLSD